MKRAKRFAIVSIVTGAVGAVLGGCGITPPDSCGGGCTPTSCPLVVATPSISPDGGSFTGSVQIAINSAPAGGWGLVTGNGVHLSKVENVQNMSNGSLQIAKSQGNLAGFGIAGEFRFVNPLDQAQSVKRGANELSANADVQILALSMP